MELKTAFSNGKSVKNVRTVGQLIEELQRLPPSLPVDQGYDDNGTDIVIFNIESGSPFVGFADGLEWDNHDEDEEGE